MGCERISAFKLRQFWRIAGGTAEGMPFVPIVGMMGIFFMPAWAGSQCVHGAVRLVIALRRSVSLLRKDDIPL